MLPALSRACLHKSSTLAPSLGHESPQRLRRPNVAVANLRVWNVKARAQSSLLVFGQLAHELPVCVQSLFCQTSRSAWRTFDKPTTDLPEHQSASNNLSCCFVELRHGLLTPSLDGTCGCSSHRKSLRPADSRHRQLQALMQLYRNPDLTLPITA